MLNKSVDCPQRKMQWLSLKKTGLGTPAISGSCANFCTIRYNGVGDYTINFTKKPFAQIPEISVSPVAANSACYIADVTALSVRIKTTDLAGVTAEGDFHIRICGSLASDLQG